LPDLEFASRVYDWPRRTIALPRSADSVAPPIAGLLVVDGPNAALVTQLYHLEPIAALPYPTGESSAGAASRSGITPPLVQVFRAVR